MIPMTNPFAKINLNDISLKMGLSIYQKASKHEEISTAATKALHNKEMESKKKIAEKPHSFSICEKFKLAEAIKPIKELFSKNLNSFLILSPFYQIEAEEEEKNFTDQLFITKQLLITELAKQRQLLTEE